MAMESNNGLDQLAPDKDTLFMLSGVALMVFGAGLILSNPLVRKLSQPDRHRKSGPGRDPRSRPVSEIETNVSYFSDSSGLKGERSYCYGGHNHLRRLDTFYDNN